LWKIDDKRSVGAEALISQVFTSSKDEVKGWGSPTYRSNMTNFAVPVYYHIKASSRVGLNFGVQFNKVLFCRQANNAIAIYKANDPTDPELRGRPDWTRTSKWFDSQYGLGVRAGMFYKLTDRAALDVNLYGDVVSNMNAEYALAKSSFRTVQLVGGIRYLFKD
jgi:hypothetical protein